jgi:RecA/RadA recombinase
MSLAKQLVKNSTLNYTEILEKSVLMTERDIINTPIPMFNVALSGDMDGGMSAGMTIFAGQSKMFKSGFSLLMAKAYIEKYGEDAAILYYDSEQGAPMQYFEGFEIPTNQVVHSHPETVEDLTHDLVNQLEKIERGMRVMIIVDSVGNLASRKEVDDAISGSDKADFTRPKKIRSFFRVTYPKITNRNLPMVVVNHTYQNIGSFISEQKMSGGEGIYYNADTIFFITRKQDKDKQKELQGWQFNMKVEKSRFVKEKSVIPINLKNEGGISKWSGLFDIALELGYIKRSGNTYSSIKELEPDAAEFGWSRADIEFNDDFWTAMLEKTDIKQAVHDKYALSSQMMEKVE